MSTSRDIRAARRAGKARLPEVPDDFDVAELPVSPMTPEDEAEFADQYQLDAIAENTGPVIPGRY